MKIILATLALFLVFSGTSYAETASLTWTASASEDVAGYRVYVREDPGEYGPPVDVGNVTAHQVDALDSGKTYSFTVTAYDASGNESVRTVSISKSFIDSVPPLPPTELSVVQKIARAAGLLNEALVELLTPRITE